ncbi:MAG: AAA family ATPase [Lachnospiraceae bacterium]|jgi:AAA15 family ATPase/GTPase
MAWGTIGSEEQKMVVMDVIIDNFFAFKNFHMNMAYPQKKSNSYIENEYLEGHPNFRYKKVNILMGANATGKTSFGRTLMAAFNFMDKKQFQTLTKEISDEKKQAFFSMDFIVDEDSLYRFHVKIRPKSGEKYQNSDIAVTIKKVHITKADSYESCSKRLDKMISEQSDSYIEELDKIEGLSWLFEYPSNSEISYSVHNLESDKSYLKILEYTLKALDSSIKKVERIDNVENSYVIRMEGCSVIIQNGKIVDTNILSSGTKAGIEIAGFLTGILNGNYGFYYCDEKFSYIHSDIEKAFLAVMIQSLKSNDQLFFTTHNTEILDLPLPKHSFTFLKKDSLDDAMPIKCIDVSRYLKHSTDSLKNAVDNDLFSVSPSVDYIYKIAEL